MSPANLMEARVAEESPAPIFGRSGELAFLRNTLDAVCDGRARFVLVEGEAGIGKTRLVTEMTEMAQAKGASVFAGAAEENESAWPFRALTEAFEIRGDAPDAGRREIARLLEARMTAPDTPLQIAPELAFRMSDAIIAVIEAAAGSGPVLVALDDVHWADAATLGVLASAARRTKHLPVLVLLTYRPTTGHGELDRLIETFVRQDGVQLRLQPLDHEAMADLVAAALGAQPGPNLLAQIEGAAGNPLYAVELVGALAEEGDIETVDGHAESRAPGIPEDLRLMLVRRLSVLPADTLELLRLAAVLGPTFAVAELGLLSGRSAPSLVGPLEAAIRAGVLGERGARLAFRHALIRTAVYEDMSAAMRKALHREAGHLLSEAGAPADLVAPHMTAGAEAGDVEAVTWLRRAAHDAAARSILVSIELLERARTLVPTAGRERDAIEAELLVRLVHGGRAQEAEVIARGLLDRDAREEHQMLAHEALAIALTQQNRSAEARDEWSAIVAAPHTSDVRRAMALADMSQASLQMLDPDTAAPQAREALAIDELLRHPRASCAARMTLSLVAAARGRVEEAVDQGRRAVSLAESVRVTGESFPAAELAHGLALLDADRLEESETTLRDGRERAEGRGLTSQVPPYHWGMVGRHFFAGRWDDAIAEAEAGLDLVEETGYRAGVLVPYALLSRMHLSRDNIPAAEQCAAAGEAEFNKSGPAAGLDFLLWARALLYEATGNSDAALAVLGAVWDLGAPMRYLLLYRSLAPDLVRLALGAGNSDRARAVTEEVEEGARRSPSATSTGCALRCRGLLERDAESLQRSVDSYESGPRPHDVALAAEDAAGVLGAAGSGDETGCLLDKARAIHAELGADRDAARVEESLRALGRSGRTRRTHVRAAFGWDALTRTESEVVKFVADGLTSPQIGARMFISPRTVQTHLKHVFQKVGCSTRTELAAEATRRDQG